MKHIVRKAFWDYEKEEKWLNEMSAKGLALTDYSWCRYVFEETPRGQYIYRIELLEHTPTHPESVSYIKFLEETGVEYTSSYMRWIYLRKKASEGSFDIYSDTDSKINHYKRINAFWNTLMCLEFAIGISNIFIGSGVFSGKNYSTLNLVLGGILIVVGILFFRLGMPLRKKMKLLNKEKTIRE